MWLPRSGRNRSFGLVKSLLDLLGIPPKQAAKGCRTTLSLQMMVGRTLQA